MDTVTLTIDGREITVEKGKTVLQAAIEHGISVPYYCYHPGIGIDGSCRVCVVKIEKMPKLQTSCSTVCTDGMVVETRVPEVVEARAGVFEFLLVNHPLDCPVCDKGGECPLQDFSYRFGPSESRMDFPRRVFDGEGVRGDVDFGPALMLNRQRCIMCTRCVRFMSEVDGDAQIGVANRGYGSEIATFRDEGVHSLISGNLMDVCPVGAITTRQYRFKSRPWDNPNVADTICTQCAKGCNVTAWVKAKPEWAKGSQLVRFTPRLNPDVNGYWMCDIGRFDYHWIEGDNRVRAAARAREGPCSSRCRGATLGVEAARSARRRRHRRTPMACGSCSRLMRRTKSFFCSGVSPKSSSAPTDRWRSRSAGGIGGRHSRTTRSSRCRPSTRRTSTARGCSASSRPRRRRNGRSRRRGAAGAAVAAAACRRSTSSIRGPTVRSATPRGSSKPAPPANCRCSSSRAC